MALKTLLVVGAVFSSVMGLELNPMVAEPAPPSEAEKAKLCPDPAVSADYKKFLGCVVDMGSNSTDKNTVTTNTATSTLKLFRSQPSLDATPKVFGARIGGVKAKEAAAAAAAEQARKAAEEAELQKKSTEGSGLLDLLVIIAFVAMMMMLTPMGRNSLIATGLVSPDSELTKMSIKASGGLAAQLANFPLVEQAAAALGFLHQDKKWDEEMGVRTLINESDGDSEDEAEIIVDLGNLSRPMNNVVDRKTDDFDLNPSVQTSTQDIDLGSPPMQQDFVQDLQAVGINIDYQDGDFATDDFFDEDDDF